MKTKGAIIDSVMRRFPKDEKEPLTITLNQVLLIMEEYSEQNCDAIYNLFNKPAQKLKPLEDLYRKENPRPDGKFYHPDTTQFYEWIAAKIMGMNNIKN